jgi:phospholipase/lecithinase/hemolysin
MKKFNQCALLLSLLIFTAGSASAAFSSLYVFGDGLSTSTDPIAPGGAYYYGQRWSNGRVWVEVLAQRQGLAYNAANNDSYWDHNSSTLASELNNFTPPADVANDLFIVWVCNADTYDATKAFLFSSSSFTNANILSQANHFQIITNLYAKGVRTLIMPNAVDISEIPRFNAGTAAAALHAGCVDYNTRFSNTLAQACALCPGLTIYEPDFYTLLNNALANAAYYGLTNALSAKGFSIDACSDPNIANLTLNGQGTNYIFWDPQDPTAQFHAIMADTVQQLISPVQISKLTAVNGSNQVSVTLNVVNMPVGLNGFVDGSTNLASANWTMVTNFNSQTTTQTISLVEPPFPPLPAGYTNYTGGGSVDLNPYDPPSTNSASGPPFVSYGQFYKLRFPYAWNWP